MQELIELGAADMPEQILEPDEAAAFRRFKDGLLRRALGMPHDLNKAEEALAEAGEAALAELAGDGD